MGGFSNFFIGTNKRNLAKGGTSVYTTSTGIFRGTSQVHMFTASGVFTVTSAITKISFMAVGGGGGAGNGRGGGGGGGGVVYGSFQAPSNSTFTISIGGGGAGGPAGVPVVNGSGANGGNSTITRGPGGTWPGTGPGVGTAYGGGGGAGGNPVGTAKQGGYDGGSGGGGYSSASPTTCRRLGGWSTQGPLGSTPAAAPSAAANGWGWASCGYSVASGGVGYNYSNVGHYGGSSYAPPSSSNVYGGGGGGGAGPPDAGCICSGTGLTKNFSDPIHVSPAYPGAPGGNPAICAAIVGGLGGGGLEIRGSNFSGGEAVNPTGYISGSVVSNSSVSGSLGYGAGGNGGFFYPMTPSTTAYPSPPPPPPNIGQGGQGGSGPAPSTPTIAGPSGSSGVVIFTYPTSLF